MKEYFKVVPVGKNIMPTKGTPFVIEVQQGQPINLKTFRYERPGKSPTATVITVPPRGIVLSLPKLREVLNETNPAEGIIFVDSKFRVLNVLNRSEVEAELSETTRNLLSGSGIEIKPSTGKFASYEPLSGGYESLPRKGVDLSPLVYKCSEKDCSSPPIVVFQKGQEIPPCLVHNKPRIRYDAP